MIDKSKYEGHYTDDFARFWVTADDELNADIERANATTNLIDDAPLLLAEVERLREILYKCWKDSGQSVYYLQVDLLKDQEYWYQEMMCKDGSCEDCECDEE